MKVRPYVKDMWGGKDLAKFATQRAGNKAGTKQSSSSASASAGRKLRKAPSKKGATSSSASSPSSSSSSDMKVRNIMPVMRNQSSEHNAITCAVILPELLAKGSPEEQERAKYAAQKLLIEENGVLGPWVPTVAVEGEGECDGEIVQNYDTECWDSKGDSCCRYTDGDRKDQIVANPVCNTSHMHVCFVFWIESVDCHESNLSYIIYDIDSNCFLCDRSTR